ncbi:hypothetical protein Tco_0851808 [Tanacetum coccineum]
MSSKDAKEEKTKSDYDDTINLTGSMVESYKKKKMKKFYFVTEQGDHVHFTKEQITEQKRIDESDKADVAKQEVEARKRLHEVVDLSSTPGKAQSRIINCDVLTRKGPITLKVYKEDGTDEVIPNFKANDLYLDEWREVLKACPNKKGAGEQDPLYRLNDIARKKMKHADDIHDLFRYTKKCKSSVKYGDHPAGTVLYKPILGMILLHQGLGLDDHARTSSSFLLAEVNKRNLNPLKQMRAIEQLRQ